MTCGPATRIIPSRPGGSSAPVSGSTVLTAVPGNGQADRPGPVAVHDPAVGAVSSRA